MQKTLKGFHVGKRARILVEGLKGMEVLDRWEVLKGPKVLKVLKSEGGVCNEWVTNKGWARFLYIVYILWAPNMGP